MEALKHEPSAVPNAKLFNGWPVAASSRATGTTQNEKLMTIVIQSGRRRMQMCATQAVMNVTAASTAPFNTSRNTAITTDHSKVTPFVRHDRGPRPFSGTAWPLAGRLS